jgi:hypothetical protein
MGMFEKGPDPVGDPGDVDVDHDAIRAGKKRRMNPPQKKDQGMGPTTAHRHSDPGGDAAPPSSTGR